MGVLQYLYRCSKQEADAGADAWRHFQSCPCRQAHSSRMEQWGMLKKAISMGGGQMPSRTKQQNKRSLCTAQSALLLGQQLCSGFKCVPGLVPASVSAPKFTVGKGNQQKLQLYLGAQAGVHQFFLSLGSSASYQDYPLGLSQGTQDFCVYLDQFQMLFNFNF